MPDTLEPTFITRPEAAPGVPLVIPASHVTYSREHGYAVIPGIGRQASTAGAAR